MCKNYLGQSNNDFEARTKCQILTVFANRVSSRCLFHNELNIQVVGRSQAQFLGFWHNFLRLAGLTGILSDSNGININKN